MSVKLIDSKQTLIKEADGIVVYQNPALQYDVYSDGRIYSHKSSKFMNKTANGLFSVSYSNGSGVNQPIKFESLVCHLLGIKRNKRTRVELKNKNLGFVPGNIKVINIDTNKEVDITSYKEPDSHRVTAELKTVPVALHEAETSIVTVNGYKLKSTKANLMYITEDAQIFDNLFDANSHQLIVDKGKEAAQIVLKSNAGFILAEEIFRTHVKNTTKKYKNFKDVVENNSGVSEVGKSDMFKFIDQPGLGEYKKDILSNEFTYDQAEKLSLLLRSVDNSLIEIIDILK